ncbi:hypothetical protein [Orbus mooreae]|uniref:hypothetical protein n=1 Tax=Orbus mooreae TaxID=3074107 RepID=UPI00370DCE30
MEWLNYISAFLTSIVAAIGLYFIWKQIKIAKNQNVFFNFQKNLESELNFYFKKNYDFFTEYEELSRSIYNKSDTNYDKYLRDNYFNILKKYENIFYPQLITLDKWWLGKNYTEFEKLINSEEYKNIINFTRHLYNNQTCFLVENEDEDEYVDLKKRHIKINKLIRNEQDEYRNLLEVKNKLESKTTEFLEKLAKAKGVL